MHSSTTYRCHVITLSDRASRGEYNDESGTRIVHCLKAQADKERIAFKTERTLIPDDANQLAATIHRLTNQEPVDVIFTTGGTGIGPRDITPDTLAPMFDKTLPGIMELIRVKYALKNPRAALSRGVAGTIKQTLVFTLPGSKKAVDEYCQIIMPLLIHALEMLHGDNTNHPPHNPIEL